MPCSRPGGAWTRAREDTDYVQLGEARAFTHSPRRCLDTNDGLVMILPRTDQAPEHLEAMWFK